MKRHKNGVKAKVMLHEAYLSIGSNIEPEKNLPKAIQLLRDYGEIRATSSAWESRAVGSNGPNFLNASVMFITPLGAPDLKERVIRPIEATLGRVRSADKFAPRTMDIDITLFDGAALNNDSWAKAFVIVPLAELLPDLDFPPNHEKLSDVAERMRRQTWIVARPEVLASVYR
jgi:2-amino-4-hydroxy-6-hydroxymethyldihydropteridine diphosphokinase